MGYSVIGVERIMFPFWWDQDERKLQCQWIGHHLGRRHQEQGRRNGVSRDEIVKSSIPRVRV